MRASFPALPARVNCAASGRCGYTAARWRRYSCSITRAKAAPRSWRGRPVAASNRSLARSAMLRTVPPVSASSEAAPKPVPEQGPPYATLEELRRADGLHARQPDPLRQHGGAAEVLSRRHRRALARWDARRQAGRGVHGHPDHARRPGEHAAVDDAAAPASRHVPGRPALQRAGAAQHAQRRHALRRLARRRRAAGAHRRGTRAGAGARPARRAARGHSARAASCLRAPSG